MPKDVAIISGLIIIAILTFTIIIINLWRLYKRLKIKRKDPDTTKDLKKDSDLFCFHTGDKNNCPLCQKGKKVQELADLLKNATEEESLKLIDEMNMLLLKGWDEGIDYLRKIYEKENS